MRKLDFEMNRHLKFKVIAMDGGSPRLSSEAYVYVSLLGMVVLMVTGLIAHQW